jgi:CubicO group peptidase (beta-lactamase class C family)
MQNPQAIENLESWIDQTLREAGTPGAAVVLERNGERLLARGFGHRDVQTGLSPDVDTVFGSGSVTKSFTALAILLLEEEGKLATSDPVAKHLPELRLPGADPGAVSLHHLLTHSSGLPPLPTRHYAWLSQDDLETFEREEIAAFLRRLPPRAAIGSFEELLRFLGEHGYELHAAPGEQFSYSNEGYGLLGALVERVSRTSLPTFVRERILAPAGMKRSSMNLRFTLSLGNVTRLYVRRGNEIAPSSNWFDPLCWSPAGGLRSSAADLARYFRMLASDGELDGVRIATAGSIEKMTTAYARKDATEWYGHGLALLDFRGHSLIRHGGAHKGVASCAGFAPAEGIVCTVLTNLANSPAEKIWDSCMRVAFGLTPGPLCEPSPTLTLPLDVLRSFAGTYYSPESGGVKVLVDDEGIAQVRTGEVSVRARATAEDTLVFAGPRGDQTIRFLRLRGDGISHASIGGRLVRRR